MHEEIISAQHLVKVFRSEDVETLALNDVNLSIKKGDFLAIMGPSGCGKSTLLNILGLLDLPTTGKVYFMGHNTRKLSDRALTNLRKENIGFIFQSFNLIDELTVFENVELPLIYLKVPAKERKKKVDEVLEKVHIKNRHKYYPPQLSGGQQQRVAIARAVVTKPRIILADEPTGNLDSANSLEIMEMLTRLNQEGTTLVIVTHSIVDAEHADRIIQLYDGHLVTENIKRVIY